MPTEYEVRQDLTDEVDRVFSGPDFGTVREFGVIIKSCLIIKTVGDDSEDFAPCRGDAAKLKKIGPPFSTFMDGHFILVFDAGVWENFHGTTRVECAIHKALMRIQAEVSDSGDLKVRTRNPDFQEFSSTIRRYGPAMLRLDDQSSIANAARELARLISNGAVPVTG